MYINKNKYSMLLRYNFAMSDCLSLSFFNYLVIFKEGKGELNEDFLKIRS